MYVLTSVTLINKCCEHLWAIPFLPRRHCKKIYKHLPDTLKSFPFEVDFYGFTYTGDLQNRNDREVFFKGAFEKDILYCMRDVIKSLGTQVTVLDVGANVGQHALFLSPYAEHVYAFEPYQPVRQIADYHFRSNNLNNVTLYPVGLSDESMHLPFYPPPSTNLGKGSFDSDFQKATTQPEILEVVNGDNFLEVNLINHVDLIKIDVEGFEKKVLQGLTNTLKQSRPIVFFELSKHVKQPIEDAAALYSLFPEGYEFKTFHSGMKFIEQCRLRWGKYQLVDLDMQAFQSDKKTKQLNVIAFPNHLAKGVLR